MTLIKELDVEKCNEYDSNVLKPMTGSSFKLNTNLIRSIIQKFKNANFTGKPSNADDSTVIVKSPKKQTKISTKITPEMCEVIRSYIDEDCLLTLEEINSRLDSDYEIRYDLEKIAGCLLSFHYSIARIPDLIPKIEFKYANVMRTLFARQILEAIEGPDLYFLGITKLVVNTRVDHGKKASPRWATKSKTFTVCVAMEPEGLFMYDVEEDPTPFSSSPNVSPAGSPEVKKEPYTFYQFLKKFMARIKQNGVKKGTFVMDGHKLQEAMEEDTDLLYPRKPHTYISYPYDSSFFSPTELLFDQMRYHIARLNPTTPEGVFSAVKNIPSVLDEVDCSLYCAEIWNYVDTWSRMSISFEPSPYLSWP